MPSSLYWDRKGDNDFPNGPWENGQRAMLAGCGPGDRCTKEPYGSAFVCDAFPFETTEQDKTGQHAAINRCVPVEQNNGEHIQTQQCRWCISMLTLLKIARATVLKDFYHSLSDFENKGMANNPDWFKLAFADFGQIGYCQPPESRDCTYGASISINISPSSSNA